MLARAGDMRFGIADFRARAAAQDPGGRPGDHGDHVLNPDYTPEALARQYRHAAVLIGAVDHPDGASVILTQRASHLRSHSGQVAFPGGVIDPGDGSPEVAALREANEEIGLEPSQVEIVGRLPDYLSGSGYRISPVLAVVRPNALLTPNPDEVDAIFETPLAFLADRANHQRDSRVWQGKERFFYTMPYGERHIWGVTAGIIRMMTERLWP